MTLPSEFVLAIAEILDRLNIPYHVGGSIASSAYGSYRMTADADFVIEANGPALERLAAELEHEFYVSGVAMQEALANHSTFNAIHMASSFKIDFFIRGSRDFDLEEFRRSVPYTLSEGSGPIQLKSPEDTILRKLEWFTKGGSVSDQQWRDIVSVLEGMGARLDFPYLDHWARTLDVSDLLARAIDDSRST